MTAAARPRGIKVISSGTHPFGIARDQDISPDPRYHQLIESMQWPARRLLICGMHVHVGIDDNDLRRLYYFPGTAAITIPALLADGAVLGALLSWVMVRAAQRAEAAKSARRAK